jgi:hypothetical protein
VSKSPFGVEKLIDLTGGKANGVPEIKAISQEGPTWIPEALTSEERQNVEVVRRFWESWRVEPFDPNLVRGFLTEDAFVRIGWRGEAIYQGREVAIEAFTEEVKRQVEYGEKTDLKFPVLVAKGPVVFHTWTWISSSQSRGYRFERPMATFFLFRGSLIERWDSYATGKESSPDYVQGKGPDGL